MNDFELMCEVLADEEVKHCRFLCDENTGKVDFCEVFHEDGSDGMLIRRDGKWRWIGDGPPHDAATATGMYDRD